MTELHPAARRHVEADAEDVMAIIGDIMPASATHHYRAAVYQRIAECCVNAAATERLIAQ